MYGYNVFAVLTPCDEEDKARKAFALVENATWFQEATGDIAEEPTIDSREPTPAPPTPNDVAIKTSCSIILTLDKPLKNPLNGFQFGTSIPCDVLLGRRGTRGISSRQFNIAIDEHLWVWLHDHHSTYGTAVGYNHQAKNQVHTKETWILAYAPGVSPPWNDVRVCLAFKVDFPNHLAAHPQYIANLRAFLERNHAALPLVGELGLDTNPITAAPSQPRTPGARPIYYKDRLLGRGQFGEVHKVIRTRDGKAYAGKTFFAPPKSKKRKHGEVSEYDAWLKMVGTEISIMRNNRHPNVMAAVEFLDEPEPWLLMPYFSQGYLGELWTPSEEECASALRQILAGLSYLHANGVVHRDLKPRNLLVGGPAYTIVITDFGLSRASVGDSLIKSFVGSMKYLAPEVVPGASSGYGPTVDVYAAGVIIMEQMYGTPDPPELPAAGVSAAVDAIWDWSQRWAEQLVQNLDEWSDNEDLVLTLLRRMIVVNPEDRLSARECLETGCEIRLFRRTDDGRVMDMVDVNRAPSEATTEIDPAEDDRTKTPVQ